MATLTRPFTKLKNSLKPKQQSEMISKPAIPLRETYYLTNSWQLFDEVIFIIRRNLPDIAFAGFIAAIPKFLMIFLIFAAPPFAGPILFFDPTTGLCVLGLLHQIFWRPLVWQSTGNAFLAGFPEKRVRALAKSDSNRVSYKSLFLRNLLTAVLYSALQAMLIVIFLSNGRGEGIEWPILIAWFFIWTATMTVIPTAMLGSKDTDKTNTRIFIDSFGTIFWLSVRFVFILAVLFGIFLGSSMAIIELLGIPLDSGMLNLDRIVLILCFIIAADCLIDPFVIGFRLLLTKLCMEKA